MVGRTISHYEIIEKLGEGGMGVVYKARDTHLDRFVAIKVLPPEKVADAERKRRFGGDGEEVHPRLWTEPNQEPRTGSKNYLENNQGFATKNLPQGPINIDGICSQLSPKRIDRLVTASAAGALTGRPKDGAAGAERQ